MLVTVSFLTLSACTAQPANSTATSSTTTATQTPAQNVVKQGTTTKTGKIIKLGGTFYIQEVGKQPAGIDSYKIDLSQYLNQTVTITGQYSGDTLFVGSVTPAGQ